MPIQLGRILFWLPRLAGILFVLFLSLFALDVVNQPATFGNTLLALLIHLIPSLFMIVVLATAWRKAMIGGMLIIGIALLYLITSEGRGWVLSLPLFVIGILFLLNRLLIPKTQ